ncbi:MAG: DUF177 domain-containing protein [Elusimicrobia bacterium]|nr:DUF177 domain-containing protein [Elusimicrobiota bacterium]
MKDKLKFYVKDIINSVRYTDSFMIDPNSFKDCFSDMVITKDITVTVNFSLYKNLILLNGSTLSRVTEICSRCAEPFETVLKEDFSESYSQDDECIDINSLVRETLTLSEPMKPLCSKQCRTNINNFDKIEVNNKEGDNYAKSKEKTYKGKKR